jgi:hypothetical protein
VIREAYDKYDLIRLVVDYFRTESTNERLASTWKIVGIQDLPKIFMNEETYLEDLVLD